MFTNILLCLMSTLHNIIDTISHHFIGEYSHYDTIIYPHDLKVESGMVERLKGWFKTWSKSESTGDSTDVEMQFLPNAEMAKFCLETYLEEYKTMMCATNVLEKFDIVQLVTQITRIYKMTLSPGIMYRDGFEIHPHYTALQKVVISSSSMSA